MEEISVLDEYKKCKVCNSEIKSINNKFDLVECVNCELVFCKNIYSQETFIKVYNRLYNQTLQYNTHIKESEFLLENKNIRIGNVKLKILKYLIQKKVNCVSEIGAGVGLVANYFKSKGITYQGIELDSKTVERAKVAGFNIVEGDFKVLNELSETQDAVVAFEVIEHLQDLNELFLILQKKVKQNGYFGFTVPNYNKRLNFKNPSNKIYQSAPPIHLNFFTVKSIENISSYYGFEVIFCKEKKYPYFLKNKLDTYKNFIKGFFGHYRGPTIMAILKKK